MSYNPELMGEGFFLLRGVTDLWGVYQPPFKLGKVVDPINTHILRENQEFLHALPHLVKPKNKITKNTTLMKCPICLKTF